MSQTRTLYLETGVSMTPKKWNYAPLLENFDFSTRPDGEIVRFGWEIVCANRPDLAIGGTFWEFGACWWPVRLGVPVFDAQQANWSAVASDSWWLKPHSRATAVPHSHICSLVLGFPHKTHGPWIVSSTGTRYCKFFASISHRCKLSLEGI